MCTAVRADGTAAQLKKFGSLIFSRDPNQSVNTAASLHVYFLLMCESQLATDVSERAWGGGTETPPPTAQHGPSPRDGQHQKHPSPSGSGLPGVSLWPVRTGSPLPGCSQVVLWAASLLRQEEEIIQFSRCASPATLPTPNRAEKIPGGGNYLMKKTRPSRVTP